ncbi:DUF4012 domain-containing protein [Agromyces sp. MMS24-K17]|uniref:DUF4012 domain-containing protein n=1 Tax=Agromyces sp. MMS24-K17 TaxID=3372850 RepID=UPI0037541953
MTEAVEDATEPRRHRRAIRIAVAVAAAILIAAVTWVAVRGWLAKGELEAAIPVAQQLAESAGAGVVEVDDAVTTLQQHTAEAASLTSDPIWRLGESVPWVGDDLHAVRAIAESAHSLAEDVGPLVDAAAFGDDGVMSAAGHVDLGRLASLEPAVAAAASDLVSASRRIGGLPAGGLLEPVADARERFDGLLSRATPIVTTAATALRLAPPMLGADGPRDYLVLVLNNAELRTTGGIPGAIAQVHVEDGAMSLARIGGNGTVRSELDGFDPLPEAETALWGDKPTRFVQNVTMTPDFALTAALAREFWLRSTGTDVDGVIAVDPGFLAGVLAATGPIEAGGDTLSADDVVRTLLVDSYSRIPDADALDEYFAQVGSAVFDRLTAGDVDAARLLDASASAAREGRISMWSADAGEQGLLATTTLGGPSAALDAAGPESYGVYLNDTTGAKMDPYLDVEIATGTASCRGDGLADVGVRVTLTNSAPADAADTLPFLVALDGRYGVPPGSVGTDIAVYGAPGSFRGGVRDGGDLIATVDATAADRPVSMHGVVLAPGESRTVEYRFVAAEAGQGRPVVRHTPLVDDPEVSSYTPACG